MDSDDLKKRTKQFALRIKELVGALPKPCRPSSFLKQQLVEPLLKEANELAKIMAKSRISALTGVRPLSQLANRQSAIANRK